MLPGLLAAVAIFLASFGSASAEPRTSHQQLALDIFKELVEINTVTATGDTARAAEAMAVRLRAAGFAASDVQVLVPAPRKGNLVARLRGTGKRKPILLLAHTDVVDARPEDWSVDPFKLTEREGYFYGRGTTDDKFMAAVFVANLIRYKQEGYTPERDIIVALEADEEIGDAMGFGIRWLLANHRPLIDAEFALNEGGRVGLKAGKPLWNSVQVAEKVSSATSWKRRTEADTARCRPRTTRSIAWPKRSRDFLSSASHSSSTKSRAPSSRARQRWRTRRPRPTCARSPPVAPISTRCRSPACRQTRCTTRNCAPPALPRKSRADMPSTRCRKGERTVNCRVLPGEPIAEVYATLKRVLADDGDLDHAVRRAGAQHALFPARGDHGHHREAHGRVLARRPGHSRP